MAKRRAENRKPPKLSEPEARLYRHEVWARVVTKIGRRAVSWAGIAFCTYWAAQPFIEWSGKTTEADLHLALSGSGWREAVVLVSILFGAGGFLYGKWQRHLMRKTVRHLEGPKRVRETELDPHRSSSGLTRSGETPEEED